jgi:hypothetical protein
VRRLLVCSLLALACDTSRKPAPPAPEPERSPNARLLPTPLVEKSEQLPRPEPFGSSSSTRSMLEPPPIRPTPLNPLYSPEPDVDQAKSKDAPGLAIHAIWRWPVFDTAPLEPESDAPAITEASSTLKADISIELHPSGHMRWEWTGSIFPLPPGTELRARIASYGHVLVWPGETKYRVLAPGALRAVLEEHRADATPLVLGSLRRLPEGKRLGRPTEVSEISTAHGTLILHQLQLDESASGASLICRALVELISASPASAVCTEDHLPLYAEIKLADGGRSSFEVTELPHKADGVTRLPILPASGTFQLSALPDFSPLLIDQATQRKLHSRDRGDAQSAQRGLTLTNSNPVVAYLSLDRVQTVMLGPFETAHLSDLRAGRYRATWHGFFGTVLRGPELVDVPGRMDSHIDRGADAGAPRHKAP